MQWIIEPPGTAEAETAETRYRASNGLAHRRSFGNLETSALAILASYLQANAAGLSHYVATTSHGAPQVIQLDILSCCSPCLVLWGDCCGWSQPGNSRQPSGQLPQCFPTHGDDRMVAVRLAAESGLHKQAVDAGALCKSKRCIAVSQRKG